MVKLDLTWKALLDKEIVNLAEHTRTAEGRKDFRLNGGPEVVKGLRQTLAAFSDRLNIYDNLS